MNQLTFLDRLTVNVDSDPTGRRSLTREETFVLGWFIHHSTNRTYSEMARECKLSLEQCRGAVLGLREIGLLRLS
ncbi:MAG: hypothetical protein F6J93_00270 [Oscillatoria sp. SIO1A7]|nr:hypothetical protein [Oscillatoria sp. SIO1A7]